MLSDELRELRDNHRRIKAALRQVERDIAWNRVIDSAIRMCRLLRKAELAELDAKYRADQPRVPAGNPDGGQWTDVGGGASATSAGDEGRVISDANPDNYWKPGSQLARAKTPPGIGHNDPPPDEPPKPPKFPQQDPQSQGQNISLARAVANYMAATSSLVVLEGWALAKVWPMVQSSFDVPRSFADLQRSHLPSEAGYHDHHVAEQASAAADGFSRARIDGAENVCGSLSSNTTKLRSGMRRRMLASGVERHVTT